MENKKQKLLFIFKFRPDPIYANVKEVSELKYNECLLKEAHIYYGTPANKVLSNCQPCLILKLIDLEDKKKFSFILAKPKIETNFIGEVMCNSRDDLFKKEDGSVLKVAYEEDYQEIFHFCRRSLEQYNLNLEDDKKMRNNLYDLWPSEVEN